MKLIESQTYLNLAKAFAGECQDYVRYKFVEYGARYNKFENIAKLIDKIAYQEFNHARIIYTFIQKASKETIKNIDICTGYPFKQKWDLEQNLQISAEDENFQGTKTYPEYAKIATEEGFEEIATLFENLGKIELYHEKTFLELYNQMKNNSLYKKKSTKFWVCESCGYVCEGKEPWPDTCPVCEAERQALEIDL